MTDIQAHNDLKKDFKEAIQSLAAIHEKNMEKVDDELHGIRDTLVKISNQLAVNTSKNNEIDTIKGAVDGKLDKMIFWTVIVSILVPMFAAIGYVVITVSELKGKIDAIDFVEQNVSTHK